MTKNMGNADRLIRLIVAVVAAIIAFGVVGASTPFGIILIIVAVIMVLTSAIGFCPLYKPLGINTCKRD